MTTLSDERQAIRDAIERRVTAQRPFIQDAHGRHYALVSRSDVEASGGTWTEEDALSLTRGAP